MLEKPQIDHQITKQLINVINAQAKLIDKLLHNQKHLLQSIRNLSGNESSSLSNSFLTKDPTYSNIDFKKTLYEFDGQREREIKAAPPKKTKNIIKILERELFESQMSKEEMKEQSDHSEYKVMKIPETKNVIKNFSKSLFRFIQKHRVYVSRVLKFLEIKEEEFQSVFQRFKGQIYTIMELKLLWLDEGNNFHKAFRIISLEYLRKHGLNHIFNSRVINYKTHIKYRKKMCEILQNPNQFSSIKYD